MVNPHIKNNITHKIDLRRSATASLKGTIRTHNSAPLFIVKGQKMTPSPAGGGREPNY